MPMTLKATDPIQCDQRKSQLNVTIMDKSDDIPGEIAFDKYLYVIDYF